VAGLDAHQRAARFDDRSRDRRARIAARLDAKAVGRLGHPRDARNARDDIGEALPAGVDADHLRTAEHVAQ